MNRVFGSLGIHWITDQSLSQFKYLYLLRLRKPESTSYFPAKIRGKGHRRTHVLFLVFL